MSTPEITASTKTSLLERAVPLGANPVMLARTTLRLLGAVLLWRFAVGSFYQTATMAPELFHPPSTFSWLTGPLDPAVIAALRTLGAGGSCLVIFAKRGRHIGLVAAWICLAVLGANNGSFGKVMHNEVMVLLVVAAWLMVPAYDSHSTRQCQQVEEGALVCALRASIVIIAMVYFFTGYQKLLGSGLSWAWSDNLSWVLHDGAGAVGGWRAGLAQAMAQQDLLTRLLASIALGCELLFPLTIFIRAMRVPFALVMAGLHLSIYVMVGLDYSGWALPCLVVMGCQLWYWPGSKRSAAETTLPTTA